MCYIISKIHAHESDTVDQNVWFLEEYVEEVSESCILYYGPLDCSLQHACALAIRHMKFVPLASFISSAHHLPHHVMFLDW